jgi:predicted alpha/beta hydrolase family esterase
MLAFSISIIAAVLWFAAGAFGLLAFVAGAIIVTFVLTRGHAKARPLLPGGGARRSIGHFKLWSGEIAAAWSIFLFSMPLERWLMPRDVAPRRSGATPVLLIHGYVNNAGAMWRLWKALVDKGFGVSTINLEPVYAGIDAYAGLIAARIAAIRAATGAAEVTLVCHSMGGLAARAYLRSCARQCTPPGTAKVITLGSPHHGTALARFEISTNGKQMHRHSAWLAQLAADEGGAWPCPLVSVYSMDDNIVAPQLSAHLEGARNIAVEGIGHISLPLARRVIAIVLAELD